MSTGASDRTSAFIDAHHDELVAFRRHLHAYPELSNEEHETTDLVAQRLSTAGLDARVLPSGTGLVCDIGTGTGPVVALRADLDALAMDDEKQVAYCSKRPGVAHACGHDVHTTVVLGAGLALADELARADRVGAGRVRLIFEPAEEAVPGGAVEVIETGGLADVIAVYGLHCDPKIDVGCIGVRRGPMTAATDLVRISLQGDGGHTARPHLTVDLVALAGRVATEVPALVREGAASLGEALLVFGAIRAGDAANVIPAHAHLAGTFRTPDREVWAAAEALVEQAVAEVVAGTGATYVVDQQRGVPPVVNDVRETERLRAAAATVVGDEAVIEAPRSLGGDSFAWYVEQVPGTYARLGVHDPDRGDDQHDLHSSTFDVHEGAIDVGIAVLVATALEALAAATP